MRDLLPTLERKNSWVQLGALLLLILVCFVLVNIIGILLAIPFFGLDTILSMNQGYDYSNEASMAFLKYMQVVSQLGVFILPALAFAYLFNRKPVTYLKLNTGFRFGSLVVAVLVIAAAIPFVNYLVVWNEGMSLPDSLGPIERWMRNMENQAAVMTEAFLKVNTPAGLATNLLIIALLAAVGEELLFRGVLLRLIDDGIKNTHIAILVSAILFSAFHGQFFGFVPRAVLGILFGYIFIYTGSLWIPILLHLLFNAVSVVVAYLYETGYMTTNYEDFGVTTVSWIVLGSLLVTVALMVVLNQLRPKEESPV